MTSLVRTETEKTERLLVGDSNPVRGKLGVSSLEGKTAVCYVGLKLHGDGDCTFSTRVPIEVPSLPLPKVRKDHSEKKKGFCFVFVFFDLYI